MRPTSETHTTVAGRVRRQWETTLRLEADEYYMLLIVTIVTGDVRDSPLLNIPLYPLIQWKHHVSASCVLNKSRGLDVLGFVHTAGGYGPVMSITAMYVGWCAIRSFIRGSSIYVNLPCNRNTNIEVLMKCLCMHKCTHKHVTNNNQWERSMLSHDLPTILNSNLNSVYCTMTKDNEATPRCSIQNELSLGKPNVFGILTIERYTTQG